MWVGGVDSRKEWIPRDGAARTDIRTHAPRTGRPAALGVTLPGRWPRLEARSTRRVRIGARRSRRTRARTRAASTRTPDPAEVDALGVGGDLPGPARRAAGDDRKAPLPARKAAAVFGDRAIGDLTAQEIAVWRMTLSPGYCFEATQALRQVLHRAVALGDDRRQPGE